MGEALQLREGRDNVIGVWEIEVFSPRSGGFARHSHDEYVLSVNVRGRERVRLDRECFDVGTEEVTLYNPGQVQSCTTSVADGDRWSCVSLHASPAAVLSLTGGRPVEFGLPVVHAPALRAALLAGSGSAGGVEADLLVERSTVLFLRLLDRAGGGAASRCPEPADALVGLVKNRLRADLSAPVRVADLAAQVGLSREQLIRAFSRATGCPPYAWHLQARVAEGRRLLHAGLPVAEVAHLLGFADQAHFHKHFQAAYATTPGRYRTAGRRQARQVP